MTKCYGCGLEYQNLWSGCPRCKSFENIEKQTKLQQKQFKMQNGGSGGGFFSNVFALTVGLVQLFAALSVLIFKIYAFIFKKSAHIAVKGVKSAKIYNEENPNSILTKKWSERSKGYRIVYISLCVSLVALMSINISSCNEDNRVKEQLEKQAVAAGFASREEQVAAEEAGFKDKASYAKHLAEIEANKKAEQFAEQERVRQEEEKRAAETAKAEREAKAAKLSEGAAARPEIAAESQQIAPVSRREPRDQFGNTMAYWREECARFQEDRRACAVSDRPGSCLEQRLGELPAFHLHWCQNGNFNDPARYRY